MATVTVTFNLGAPSTKPKFAFSPNPLIITANTETIHWIQPNGANFDFTALAFDDTNPFSNVIVKPKEIKADDENHHRLEEHKYIVIVKASDGKYYSSKDDPITMTGGPIIRNN